MRKNALIMTSSGTQPEVFPGSPVFRVRKELILIFRICLKTFLVLKGLAVFRICLAACVHAKTATEAVKTCAWMFRFCLKKLFLARKKKSKSNALNTVSIAVEPGLKKAREKKPVPRAKAVESY